MTDEQKGGRKPRGFAAMDAEMLRGIAAQGGRAAHAMGKAHRFDSKEAREAATKRHAAKNAKAPGPDGETEGESTVPGQGSGGHKL
jgi:general stress protein YciG